MSNPFDEDVYNISIPDAVSLFGDVQAGAPSNMAVEPGTRPSAAEAAVQSRESHRAGERARRAAEKTAIADLASVLGVPSTTKRVDVLVAAATQFRQMSAENKQLRHEVARLKASAQPTQQGRAAQAAFDQFIPKDCAHFKYSDDVFSSKGFKGASEAFVASLFSCGMPAFIAELDLTVLAMNDKFEKATGLTSDDLAKGFSIFKMNKDQKDIRLVYQRMNRLLNGTYHAILCSHAEIDILSDEEEPTICTVIVTTVRNLKGDAVFIYGLLLPLEKSEDENYSVIKA